jgi:Ca2+-binding EF-hand superfamily protein
MVGDAGGGDGLTHEQFQKFMSNMKEGTATEKEIMDALEVFDKDKNGTIDCKELKTAMMEMGDNPLSKEEAEELIRRGNPEASLGSSRIEYKPFVGLMMKAIPGAKTDD